jgi:SAM-dependent methyltransferase
MGLDSEVVGDIVETTFQLAETLTDELEFEQALKRKYVLNCDSSRLRTAIRARSKTIFDEVVGQFAGRTLLDVGCGNGLVSEMSQSYFDGIQMLDVVNYLSPDCALRFLESEDGKPLPIDQAFDTVFLLTVLHHSSNPLQLLKESWKATAKRLIIIESVFGVHTQPSAGVYHLASFQQSDQLAFAVLVDWLYNRVLHDNIPVPYNFTTPDRWLEVFSECGMRVSCVRNLGQDIEIAPELHFMFVLER